MTVRDTWGLCCPRCAKDHALDVTVSMDARLSSDGSDPYEAVNKDQEWNDISQIACQSCGWRGVVYQATLSKLVDDDYEALMPDGSRVDWDERLVTTGALKVLRETKVPYTIDFVGYAEEVGQIRVMACTRSEAIARAYEAMEEGHVEEWSDGPGSLDPVIRHIHRVS